jgi:hypothetical protein
MVSTTGQGIQIRNLPEGVEGELKHIIHAAQLTVEPRVSLQLLHPVIYNYKIPVPARLADDMLWNSFEGPRKVSDERLVGMKSYRMNEANVAAQFEKALDTRIAAAEAAARPVETTTPTEGERVLTGSHSAKYSAEVSGSTRRR